MKFALASVVFALILGFAVRSVPAQEKIRVAIPLFPTAAFPVLVANDRGFFQKEGLTVEPIRINSAPTTYQALISGDVHVAAGAPTGLLPSHLQGADIVVLGSWDNLVPYVWVTRGKITDIREGTMRPLIQMLNTNDTEVVDFAYQYLHTNSEATLYPPDDAVKNLLRMSAYVDKKLGAISANRVVDLSILDELGTKRNQRVQK